MICRRSQQDSQTSLSTHRKEVRQQLGMGRQRTKGIRRTQDKTHHVASTGTLQTWRTNKTRNRRLDNMCAQGSCHNNAKTGKGDQWPIGQKQCKMPNAITRIHDKELLAIIQAFKQWKRYTRGSPIPIRVLTDHKNLVTFMTTKELTARLARWQRFLSQYNFRIKYRSRREEGKPDALTRRSGDQPTTGDKRLTRNVGILLHQEQYWDIPEGKEIKVEEMALAGFQDRDEGKIQQAYNKDNEIQAIRRNLENNVKEMKGVALGLCEWKDEHLWYQGKIWIPNDEELRTSLIRRNHDDPLAGHGGTAKTTE